MPTSRQTLKDMFLHPLTEPLKVKSYPVAQVNHHGTASIYVDSGGYGFWTTFGDLALALIEAERELVR